MSVRARAQSCGVVWEVVPTINGTRRSIVTLSNYEQAKAINNIIKLCNKSQTPRPDLLKQLKKINDQAYERLVKIDGGFSIEQAEKMEKEMLRTNAQVEFVANTLKKEQAHKERKRYLKFQSVPVPETRNVPYPDVSYIKVQVSRDGDNLPEKSGIYFLWSDRLCEYVGQSINLKKRARLGHHKLLPTDQVSYLLFDVSELHFAEAYYIGIMRPRRNFMGKC